MRGQILVLTKERLAAFGLLLCLALYAAFGGIAPAEAKPPCTAWDDHGNCIEWLNEDHLRPEHLAAWSGAAAAAVSAPTQDPT